MNKVVHFEIPFEDFKRAEKFYTDVFGWRITSIPEMQYAIAYTGPTDANNMVEEKGFINGGMFKRNENLSAVTIVLDVDDIDVHLEKITAVGGAVLRGKTPVGEMGYVAYFNDPEGNIVGLWQTRVKA